MKSDTFKLYSSLPMLLSHKVRAEIDLEALAYNYRTLREIVKKEDPDCRPICVIKADAYGHCADACAEKLLREGCDMFAVSGAEEAVAVRRVCDRMEKDADILILGYTPPDIAPELIENRIIQACFSLEYAAALSAHIHAEEERSGVSLPPLRVHLKFDTGMNRIGFAAHSDAEIAQTVKQVRRVADMHSLSVEGAFTHFSRADEVSSDADARSAEQAERFVRTAEAVRAAGIPLPMCHICNSAATVRFPQYHMDACRLGILLYGIDPSGDVSLPLRPVMKLKTVISQVHELRAGESVSYGGTYTAERDMVVATIPIGYADGFIRAYSGAEAVITARDGTDLGRAPIIGRICMDQCMIDLTGCGAVRAGDTVTLIGEEGQLEDLARRAGTINYECLCILSARVPRIVVRDRREHEKQL